MTDLPALPWLGLRPLTVKDITREGGSVISIRLSDPEGAPLPAVEPGQHFALRVRPAEGQGSLFAKCPVSDAQEGSYLITLKRWEDAASAYLHEELAVGDELECTAPRSPPPVRTPQAPSGWPGSGPKVEFARSNLSVPWSGDFDNLLELAEACGVPVRWTCRLGVCDFCMTKVIEGTVEHSDDALEVPDEGWVLTCCATPLGDIVLDM
jgi:hypothetical protein